MSEHLHTDVPLQAKALERLSQRERARFLRAKSLLAAGGGAHALVLKDMPLAGLGVYEAFLVESWSRRFQNPGEMVQLAQVALEVALILDPRGYGTKRVADVQARAWGELANAHRTADCLQLARQAFGQAFALQEQGTGDRYLTARLLDLEASLLGASREFKIALSRLDSLSSIYLDLGEPHLAGRALITQALYTSYSGEPEVALQLNERGVTLLDSQRDPTLSMHAIHNRILFLVDLERYSEARRSLFENRHRLVYKDFVTALRLRWLEGRISYGLGALVSAEIAFREVTIGLANAGMALHNGIASLELAMVLLSQGRMDEAESKVAKTREIFVSENMYRELLGTVVFLEECFRHRRITPELIQAAVSYLWRKSLEIVARRKE